MKARYLIAGTGLALVGGVAYWAWPGEKSPPVPVPAASSPPARVSGPAATLPTGKLSVPEQIEAICTALKAAPDPATVRALLNHLRQVLDALPPARASWYVQAFLATGHDASTRQDLTIGHGGLLGSASSLRVFLLDYLGRVDVPAAGQLARQILATPASPDEWAVSLRNFAWANPGPEGLAFLKARNSQLLANAAWLREPTAGCLEAFDTIVYTRDTAQAPALAALLRDQDNRATSHAAYLTLDRLTIASPAPMLQVLVEQPDLMEGREQTRANFMARADLAQPDQRALVERYLLSPGRDPAELATFAGLYPNANFMVSDNLLTPLQTASNTTLAERDRAALATVTRWQTEPRFQALRPTLEQMRQRLTLLVDQAEAGGY